MKTPTRRSTLPAGPAPRRRHALPLVVVAVVVAASWGSGTARAEPGGPSVACDTVAVEPIAALQALNAVRLAPAVCGAEARPAAPPLRWSRQLADVARDQADAMATHRRMSHHGSGERALEARLADAGYWPQVAAENVAYGYPSVAAVVDAWRASPSHCRSLMQPAAVEGGLACVDRDGTRYWALVLGAPAGRLRAEGGPGPAAGCSQPTAPEPATTPGGRPPGSCP